GIYIIKGLINQQNFEEAWNVIQEAINKFYNDYRFYKYAILLDCNNKNLKIGDNSEKTTGSKWLKNSKQIKELLLNIKGENIK
ncbi:hypothetical protein FOR87_29215, partial [Bacillus anthracis]